MEIKGSKRELEALLVAVTIGMTVTNKFGEREETAEVDNRALQNWQKKIVSELVKIDNNNAG